MTDRENGQDESRTPRGNDPETPSGSPRSGMPRGRPGRMFVLCLAAVAAGYLVANWGTRLLGIGKDGVRDFETMNTYGRIRVPKGSGAVENHDLLAETAEAAAKRVNELMSPFGQASDVRRLNEAGAGEWVSVDPETWTVVMEALRWHRLTGGAFDPTIGPLKSLFVFDRSEMEEWPSEEKLAEARSRVGGEKLLFEREGMKLAWATDGMRLDLGAIAKGYGVDRAAGELRRHGARNALVDIGGELRVLGMKPGDPPTPWRAGIRDPRSDEILEKLDIVEGALATSGNYERYFVYKGKRYEHILDPRKGVPLSEGPASVTVVHPESCLAADALATTMTVLGDVEGKAFLEEQALGLFSKGVRVIMLYDEGDHWRRVEFVVGMDGTLESREETIPFSPGE